MQTALTSQMLKDVGVTIPITVSSLMFSSPLAMHLGALWAHTQPIIAVLTSSSYEINFNRKRADI